MTKLPSGSQFDGRASDVFHGIAAGKQVVGADAFAIFENAGDLAAPKGIRNVVAEECVLRGDLVSPDSESNVFRRR